MRSVVATGEAGCLHWKCIPRQAWNKQYILGLGKKGQIGPENAEGGRFYMVGKKWSLENGSGFVFFLPRSSLQGVAVVWQWRASIKEMWSCSG